MNDEKAAPVEDTTQAVVSENEAVKGSVKRGSLVVVGLIVGSLCWYLGADRYTPVTGQARVQGYVIGVAPQVSGIVTDVWVENNQQVAEGQKLFRIDPTQYEIALAKAQSDLDNTRSQVAAGTAAVAAARANLDAAVANRTKAEKDTRRLERLREQDPGTVSTRRIEVSRATLDQARAAVVAAQADIERAIEQKGGDSDENNTMLKVAITAVEKARLDLERTVVTSSSRGVITNLTADIGLYAGAGKPVLTLVALSDVWIRAEYTENNLGHLKPGIPVELQFDVAPGRVYAGRISSIGLGVSSGTVPAPGTLPTINNSRDWLRPAQRFPVNIHFDGPPGSDLAGQLRVGGQVTVIAYSEESTVLRWLGKVYIRLISVLSYAY